MSTTESLNSTFVTLNNNTDNLGNKFKECVNEEYNRLLNNNTFNNKFEYIFTKVNENPDVLSNKFTKFMNKELRRLNVLNSDKSKTTLIKGRHVFNDNTRIKTVVYEYDITNKKLTYGATIFKRNTAKLNNEFSEKSDCSDIPNKVKKSNNYPSRSENMKTATSRLMNKPVIVEGVEFESKTQLLKNLYKYIGKYGCFTKNTTPTN